MNKTDTIHSLGIDIWPPMNGAAQQTKPQLMKLHSRQWTLIDVKLF